MAAHDPRRRPRALVDRLGPLVLASLALFLIGCEPPPESMPASAAASTPIRFLTSTTETSVLATPAFTTATPAPPKLIVYGTNNKVLATCAMADLPPPPTDQLVLTWEHKRRITDCELKEGATWTDVLQAVYDSMSLAMRRMVRRAKVENGLIDVLYAIQDPTNDYFRTRAELRRQFGGAAERVAELLKAKDVAGDRPR